MARTTTDMQLVSITKLVPYVNNARTHSPEQINKLRSSLREFGFINLSSSTATMASLPVTGSACGKEGITEVPCVFADFLSDAQKKAYIPPTTEWRLMPVGRGDLASRDQSPSGCRF